MCKNIIQLFAIVLALCLASCGHSNTPSALAEKAVDYLQNGDYEAYADLYYFPENANPEEVKKEKELIVNLLSEKFGKTKEKNGGIKSCEIVSEEVNEEAGTAEVSMKVTYGDGSTDDSSLPMKKDADGNWKLYMSK